LISFKTWLLAWRLVMVMMVMVVILGHHHHHHHHHHQQQEEQEATWLCCGSVRLRRCLRRCTPCMDSSHRQVPRQQQPHNRHKARTQGAL
jgi:hypothetical protein